MKKLLVIIVILASICGAKAQLNKPYFYEKGREYIIHGKYREAIESLNILLRNQKNDHEGFFLRGVAKYNLDDLAGAAADFSSAIELSPSYTAAFQYRAIARSRMGQYSDALDDFSKAISIRPSMAGLYYSRGVTFFLNQQFKQSVSDFDQFVRLEPRDPSGYINRGTSYLYMKDTVSAVNNYNKAIEVNPYHADGYLRRGLISLMRQKYMESIPDLDKTIELSPDASIAYFYRAMAFSNLNKIMLALNDFDQAIRLDSANSVSYFNRAILRTQIGDYNRAITDYDKVASSNPNNVLVFFNRANVHAKLGSYKEAINDYTKAIELYPDFANAYMFRSQIKHAMGDMRGSRADYNFASKKIAEYRGKLNDSTFSIYADTSKKFNQIMSLDADFGNKDFNKTQGNIQREVKLMPMFRLTILKYEPLAKQKTTRYINQRLELFQSSVKAAKVGFSTMNTNMPEDSIKAIDERLDSNTNEWGEIFIKGITQSLVSQYVSALNYYNFAINEKPNEPFAYINKSVTLAEMIKFITSLEGDYQNVTADLDPAVRLKKSEKRNKDYSEAIANLEKAAKLMPELPYIHYNLGNLMYEIGDYPKAIKYYTRAIELYPYFAEAYFNRGLIQIHLNDNQTGAMDMSKAGELGIVQAYEIVKKYCM